MQFIVQLFFLLIFTQCQYPSATSQPIIIGNAVNKTNVLTGAQQTQAYIPLLLGKRIALVVNQTSMIDKKHLVDTLLSQHINIQAIFSPEHGFRGKADAGESINDTKDSKTGIPIISLYGKKKKPAKEDLSNVDIVVFDIQDVGVRFYTYISTLHYIMEACAEQNIPLIVLDRPNPNAYFIDGEVLDPAFKSFVGMHPVPTVYGMTIGEYALMINGEGWLNNENKANIKVIPCKNYNHATYYELPVKPSPNLPDMRSIMLYPSICLFEGTTLSLGRGTDKPFQYIGHPSLKSDFAFTPMPNEGAKEPPLKSVKCYGKDLSNIPISDIIRKKELDLSILLDFYGQMSKAGQKFWLDNNFIDKLAGSDKLRHQINNGLTEKEIRNSWKSELIEFKKIRSQYLIYRE